MRERLIVLRDRRARLRENAAAEREALFEAANNADLGQQLFGRAYGLLAAAGSHKIWIGAALLGMFVLFPSRTVRWLAVGLSAWQLARRVIGLYQTFAPLIEQAADALREHRAAPAREDQPSRQS